MVLRALGSSLLLLQGAALLHPEQMLSHSSIFNRQASILTGTGDISVQPLRFDLLDSLETLPPLSHKGKEKLPCTQIYFALCASPHRSSSTSSDTTSHAEPNLV